MNKKSNPKTIVKKKAIPFINIFLCTLLFFINNIIENIINYFEDFKSIQSASIEDLDEVEGIGEIRATYIKNGLIKMEKMSSLDMHI